MRSRLPWGRFVESVIFHAAVIAVLWSSAQLWPQRPHLAPPPVFHSSDVISYDLSEYLPPLDTGTVPATPTQKDDPVYAPQPIISVPPESDNRQQTIVTPPELKLNRDVPLPNIVAWGHVAPTIPPAATAARTSDLRLPALPAPVVAPAPEVSRSSLDPAPVLPTSIVAPAPEVTTANTKRDAGLAQPAIVEPPPEVEMAAMRKSDINIGHAQVVAPAPQLPVDEQHALSNLDRASLENSAAAVVPPPPTTQEAGGSSPAGRLIALSVNPVPPSAPVEVPSGNRRGTFAATPEGKVSGTGTPSFPTNGGYGDSAGPGFRNNINGAPPGLFVGPGPRTQATSPVSGQPSGSDPKASPADPPLVAHATPPRIVASEVSPEQQSEAERKVFGARKSYSMTLNIPNLNSAGGSLVMHFSELQESAKQGDLFAPVVTRAVAPGYPLELMRENVQGTVELSAVIHPDGSVGEVRVLSDVDDRLEAYARDALQRWQFLPALRNGNPVALQAVVRIPFKPRIRF